MKRTHLARLAKCWQESATPAPGNAANMALDKPLYELGQAIHLYRAWLELGQAFPSRLRHLRSNRSTAGIEPTLFPVRSQPLAVEKLDLENGSPEFPHPVVIQPSHQLQQQDVLTANGVCSSVARVIKRVARARQSSNSTSVRSLGNVSLSATSRNV